MNGFSVGELAKKFNVGPRQISVYLYNNSIDEKHAPIRFGRRIIPKKLAEEMMRYFKAKSPLKKYKPKMARVPGR